MNRPIEHYEGECDNAQQNLYSWDKFKSIFLKYGTDCPSRQAKREKVLRDMCVDENVFLAFVVYYIHATWNCAHHNISGVVFQQFLKDSANFLGETTWEELAQKLSNIRNSCDFLQRAHVSIWRTYPNGNCVIPSLRNDADNHQGPDNQPDQRL